MLIVKKNVKEATDQNFSKKAVSELNEKVKELIERAEERSKENGRATIMTKDL